MSRKNIRGENVVEINSTTPVNVTSTGSGATADQVQGNTASGVADVGNPVKIGGIYNAPRPTFVAGQRGDIQVGTRGSLNVTIFTEDGINSVAVSSTGSDAAGTASSTLFATAFNFLLNGATWDRQRAVTTLKTVNPAALAINTVSPVWTPAAGKKFRLRGITVTGSNLAAGELVEILDGGATVIAQWYAGGIGVEMKAIMEANGYISAAANNVLNVRHQGAAARTLAVNAWGNEE